MNPAILLAILELGMLAARQLPAAVRAARETREELEKMVREGRDPTPDELRIMRARMKTLTQRLESDEVTGSE